MYSPRRALTRASDGSEPLPLPDQLEPLAETGWRPRRGQLMLIAGQPGSGKSAFTEWWFALANYNTMRFAADMTQFEVVSRQAAILTGHTLNQVEEAMDQGVDHPAIGFYEEALTASNIYLNNESEPDADTIFDELAAYLEVFNEYPEVIAFDNLRNFCEENDAADQNKFMQACQTLARETQALVVVVTHTTEGTSRDTRFPQARKEIINKISQYAQHVFTTAVDQDAGLFRMAAVKLRGAKFDPSGETFVEFVSELEKASFSPVPKLPPWGQGAPSRWGYSA